MDQVRAVPPVGSRANEMLQQSHTRKKLSALSICKAAVKKVFIVRCLKLRKFYMFFETRRAQLQHLRKRKDKLWPSPVFKIQYFRIEGST